MRYVIEETEAFRILARRAAEADARLARKSPERTHGAAAGSTGKSGATAARAEPAFGRALPDRAVLYTAVIGACTIVTNVFQLSGLL